MMNIIKADLYRILRQRGVYITVAFFIGLVVLQVATGSVGRIGISTDLLPTADFKNVTGLNAAFASMSLVDNYLYFILPLIIIIVDVDFSSGAIKNTLSSGVKRSEYYFSKLILSLVVTFIILLLNVLISVIGATILNGFGGEVNGEVISSFLKIFLPQLYLVMSVTSVGVFLIFLTKKTGAVTSLYFSFCLLPTVMIFIVSELNDKVLRLLDYDVVGNLRMLSIAAGNSSEIINRAFLIGTVYIAISVGLSLFFFKRSEIK